MDLKDKKLKTRTIVISVIFLITLIGFTLAYFLPQIVGTPKEISTESGFKALQITDSEVNMGNIGPGAERTKVFTVRNNGTLKTHYNLVWSSVTNNFSRKSDLKYSITSANGGVNIGDFVVPNTGSIDSIYDGIEIAPGAEHTYTLTIKYLNLPTIDQSADVGATFEGIVDIKSGRGPKLAPEACFNFEESGGIIKNYYSNEGNNSSNTACPKNLIVPNTIRGVAVKEAARESFYGRGITNIVLPSSLETIRSFSFSENQIKRITFPASLKLFEGNAFDYNDLRIVTFEGLSFSYSSGAYGILHAVNNAAGNKNLGLIVNKAGKSANWKSIIPGNGSDSYIFEEGVVPTQIGDVIVVKG